jgi:methyl-accepting chemotaxis protein
LRKDGQAGNAHGAVYIATMGNLTPSNALPVQFTKLRDTLETQAARSNAAVRASASHGRLIVLLIAALALPLLLLVVAMTIRSIMQAVGQFSVRIDGFNDAIGERLRPGLLALARSDFTQKLAAKTEPATITRRDELGDVMRLTESMRDTIIDCYDVYNTSTEQLSGVMARVSSSAVSVDDTSRQMASTSHQTGHATAEIAHAIESLAAKSEQIGTIVQTITAIAEQTNLLALNAAIEAARAGEQGRGFAVVAEEVRQLAEDSQGAAREISDLIGAMQAETGSVVGIVRDGARSTVDGAGVVEQAREAFVGIGNAVEDMSGRVEHIATAADGILGSAARMQQSISEAVAIAADSSASTEEISASTEQTSASTQQIAASAQELANEAAGLEQLVAQFQLSRH